MTSKYGVDPARLAGKKDIIEYFIDLDRRVIAQESSLQIGHTAIEDGDLIIRNGDIIVSETDGTVVLRIVHGGIPEVRFYPLGQTDTHRIALFGFDFEVGAENDQAVQLSVERASDGAQDGGKILLTRNIAVLSHQPDAGNETYLWLNADPVTPEITLHKGIWPNQFQYDTGQGLYPGSFVASSGFTTWTHTYASPFASSMIPVCTVLHAGSTISWVLDSQSTSQFTVRFSSTTNAKTINFWNFRVA